MRVNSSSTIALRYSICLTGPKYPPRSFPVTVNSLSSAFSFRTDLNRQPNKLPVSSSNMFIRHNVPNHSASRRVRQRWWYSLFEYKVQSEGRNGTDVRTTEEPRNICSVKPPNGKFTCQYPPPLVECGIRRLGGVAVSI